MYLLEGYHLGQWLPYCIYARRSDADAAIAAMAERCRKAKLDYLYRIREKPL